MLTFLKDSWVKLIPLYLTTSIGEVEEIIRFDEQDEFGTIPFYLHINLN